MSKVFNRCGRLLVLLAMLWAMAGCRSSGQAAKSSNHPEIQEAMARVYPALVRIWVVMAEPEGGRMQKLQGAGSGTIISPLGYVVTNHHVAGNAKYIACDMSDGERIEADLVGTDALADIAVLKLKLNTRKDPSKPLPVAAFGDSDALQVGDVVFAMGSPAAMSQSVTKGIVANTRLIMPEMAGAFVLDGEPVGSLVRWIGHDAVIYHGNSGGPLVNTRGEIIGINEIGVATMSGAIPGNLARAVAEELIKSGGIQRSWIGATPQPRLKSSILAQGVLVSDVTPESPASKAGIRSGDVILSVDGVKVDCSIPEELPLFNRQILSLPVGKAVPVVLNRDGKEMTVSVTTELRGRMQGKPEELRNWGITARDFTRFSAMEAKRSDVSGVYVDSLRSGGACGQAKPALEEGDAILEIASRPVANIQALRDISAELTAGKKDKIPVLVAFERDQQKMLTVVQIGPESDPERPIKAKKPWMGAATQVLTKPLAESLGLKGQQGVRVTRLVKDGSADKAGLQVGDILIKLDGAPISASDPADTEILPEMIRQHRVGDEVDVDVIRRQEKLKLTMKLQAPPAPVEDLKRHEDRELEFSVRELSADDRVAGKIEGQAQGVVIDKVVQSGWAQLAHLQIDDVVISIDGQATPDTEAFKRVMESAKKNHPRHIVFYVQRGIHTRFLEMEPDWDLIKD